MPISKKKIAQLTKMEVPKAENAGPKKAKALRLTQDSVWKIRFNQGARKGQNGVLTVIGGSKKYHGAPLYAIEAAAAFVDLVYFFSPKRANLEIFKMKSKSNAFITICGKKDLDAAVEKSDVVLMGNGLEENSKNKKLVNGLLRKFTLKKFVLDAGAMMLADKALFKNRTVLTPHAGEFKRCFGMDANVSNARKMARQYGCIVLLKGSTDIVTNGHAALLNSTGNKGMTRGGTGDVLAGIVAALATQNDIFLSSQAGVYLNGLAGNLVAKRQKAFTADDVARALPNAFEKALQ